jgi:hypothetical protein
MRCIHDGQDSRACGKTARKAEATVLVTKASLRMFTSVIVNELDKAVTVNVETQADAHYRAY